MVSVNVWNPSLKPILNWPILNQIKYKTVRPRTSDDRGNHPVKSQFAESTAAIIDEGRWITTVISLYVCSKKLISLENSVPWNEESLNASVILISIHQIYHVAHVRVNRINQINIVLKKIQNIWLLNLCILREVG